MNIDLKTNNINNVENLEINNMDLDPSDLDIETCNQARPAYNVDLDLIEKINRKFQEIRITDCLGCQHDSLSQKDHECIMRYQPDLEAEQYKKALQFYADRKELKPEEAQRLETDYHKKIGGIISTFNLSTIYDSVPNENDICF